MIDLHSHILAGIDDGSRDIKESQSLLRMLSAQGVDTVVATPHFYANDGSVERFLFRRDKAYDELRQNMPDNAPKIMLGAEVKYYPGIGRMYDLRKLCIQGTKLLLLEMPSSRWTEYTLGELIELCSSGDIAVVLAHVERYMKFQKDGVWDRLYDSGILMQVNASFFTDVFTRRRALSLLENSYIHFLGSDCHNVTSRPPRLGAAFEIIRKKLGDSFVDMMVAYARSKLPTDT